MPELRDLAPIPIDTPKAQERSLRSRLVNAGQWSMIVHILGQALRIVSNLITTRLLMPEAFGIMALAFSVQVVLALLSDIGLRQAIIQRKTTSTKLLNTAWTLQIIRGFAIWTVCACISIALWWSDRMGWMPGESVYSAENLPAIMIAVSFSAIVVGFQSTNLFVADRALDYKVITLIELYGNVVGLVVTTYLAWLTRSIWAFPVGAICAALVSTTLSHTWLVGPRNQLMFDRTSVRELLSFGRWVLLASTLSVLASNADKLMLGAWVSPAQLGFYSLALGLVGLVSGLGTRIFGSVAVSGLSDIARNQPDRFGDLYLKLRLPFDLMFVGGAGFVFAIGPELIRLMYDSRYEETGRIVQIISFSLIFIRYDLCASAWLALGYPKYMTWLNFAKLVVSLTVIPIGFYSQGFYGAMVAVAFQAILVLPLLFWINSRHQLNNWKIDVGALFVWPVGFGAGLVLIMVIDRIRVLLKLIA